MESLGGKIMEEEKLVRDKDFDSQFKIGPVPPQAPENVRLK